ncbi:hypothetical protein SUDANB58_00540 [Streptomyces sp. enrichment culture]|uniref:hypothetical protein n=1 Tax=Streptomyces sp. enrichment culture TaxID=1795815 RepID=UPI003F54C2A4
MKKRSMLALASLATGFVVAAVTPSHGLSGTPSGPDVMDDAVTTVEQTTGDDSFAFRDHFEEDRH